MPSAIAASFNRFGGELLECLREEAPSKNLVVAPSSVAIALALLLAGAGGTNAAQLAAALHLDVLDTAVHGRIGELLRGFAALDLHAAIRVWGQLELEAEPEFLSTARNDYGAPFEPIDVRNPVETAATLNDWIAEQTRGQIRDLVSPTAITSLTRLLLVSALYVKAPWLTPFRRESTRPARFTRRDGSTLAVPTMHLADKLGYSRTAHADVVELAFRTSSATAGPGLSMLLALPIDPKADLDFDEIAAVPSWRKDDRDGIGLPEVELALPRFELTRDVDLKSSLAVLGVVDAISPQADFTRISEYEELWVATLQHRARIEVDEEGATAAAATFVGMALMDGMPPPPPIVVRFDRPFFFLLRDNESGLVHVAGWVEDPSAVSSAK